MSSRVHFRGQPGRSIDHRHDFRLDESGHAYPAGGDVYFRVTCDPDYGKLSGRRLDDMQAGARIEVGELKEHPMDFALWKGAKPGEPAWDSPWGPGDRAGTLNARQ